MTFFLAGEYVCFIVKNDQCIFMDSVGIISPATPISRKESKTICKYKYKYLESSLFLIA